MAGKRGSPIDLNLPDSDDTVSLSGIAVGLLALFVVLAVLRVVVLTFMDGFGRRPLATAVNVAAFAYGVVWLATVSNSAVGQFATEVHKRLRTPFTWIETAILNRLGTDAVPILDDPRHIRVAIGTIVGLVLILVATALNASTALLIIVFGGGAWLAVYILRHLGHDLVNTASTTPSLEDAYADPDHYDIPADLRVTHGDFSYYEGGMLVPRNKSLGITGATRSGKTEVAKHFVAQMREQRRDDEPVVIYDHKDDFQDALAEWGFETLRLSADDSTVIWNLFREADSERDFDELGRALFPSKGGPGTPSSGGGSAFFDAAARQVFVAVLKYLRRESKKKDRDATNALLVRYFQRTDTETLYEDLTEYDDLTGAASAVDPEADRQAHGVYATVQQRVNDVFAGDFAAEPSDDHPAISIREYMADPRGRTLVLDRPQRYGASTGPIFRFLVDQAAMHALDDGSRGSYFVLDEFARLPRLGRIEELVNVGAGQQTQVVLTLQSVSQLYATYGRERGRAILSGLATEILLRAGDEETVEHYREAIGTHFKEYTAHSRHKQVGKHSEREVERETRLEEEHPFSKGDLQRLDVGTCVIVQPGGWAFGYIPRLSDVHSAQ